MKPPVFYRRFDYDRKLLPNAHLAQLEDGVEDLETARQRSGATIGYPGWNLIYYLALCHLHPDRPSIVLETGTNQGCSSIVLAQALADTGGGQLHTVELDAETADAARRNIDAAGLSSFVTVHVGDAKRTLPTLLPSLGSLDLAFLDGCHLYDDVLEEFDAVYGVLRDEGIVIFDNSYQIAEPGEDQRVHGALRTIEQRYRGSLLELPYVSWYTPGVAIWQKRG